MLYKKVYTCFVLFLLTLTAAGQEGTLQLTQQGYYIKQFSEINGLVYNQCKTVFQDSKGFLWISTFQGLSRFDGRNFTNFGLRQGLPSLDVAQVCEDSAGFIYAATTRGIVRYIGPNAKNDSCFYVYPSTTTLRNPLSGMQAIDSKTIIFQYTGGELYLLREDKISVLWNKPLKYPRCIFKDSDQYIYVYTPDTIRIYNKQLSPVNNIYFPNNGYISFNTSHTGRISAYANKQLYQLTKKGLVPEKLVPDSIVWFCRNKGTDNFLYTEERTRLKSYNSTGISDVLDLSTVSLFANDLQAVNDNTAWLPTNSGGLLRISRLPFREAKAPAGGHTRLMNGRMIFEADGQLLENADIASAYNKLKDVTIKSVHVSGKNEIWFCTSKGIFKKVRGSEPEQFLFNGDVENYGAVSTEVRGVAEHPNGDLWFYGFPGLIHYTTGKFRQYTQTNGLSRNLFVRQLVIEKNGTVLLSDFFNLFRVQGDTLIPMAEETGLPNYIPNIIKTDKNGDAWIDYHKKLFKLSLQKNGRFAVSDSIITTGSFFPSEIIKFEFDGHNNCWVSYSGGIIKVFFADQKGKYSSTDYITYTADNGLTNITGGDYFFYPDEEGNINIVPRKKGNEKVFVFPLADALERKNLPVPAPSITSILINYKPPQERFYGNGISPGGLPVNPLLNHRNNDITFNFTGALPGNPSEIVYRIMLSGYDREWVTTTETSVGYTNLPAGNYSFRVMACNANGKWSEPAVYSFTISPPWHKTWWAITLWVLLTALLLLGLFRLRLNYLRKNDALQHLRTSSRFKTRLIGLIGHDMMTQLKYIAKVASQLRTYGDRLSKQTTAESLEEINNTASHLHFFGESIIHWIKLQSQGFSPVIKELDLHQLINELTGVYTMLAAEKKNRICADVPEKLICRQDATLIRIILHNLLLNSNKFTENGLITVGASLNKSTLYLFVKDTGIGMSPEKVASLNNMQPTGSSAGTVKETGWGMGYVFIIDLIRFSSGSLQVSSTEGEGTVVTIGLPVEANDTARHNL